MAVGRTFLRGFLSTRAGLVEDGSEGVFERGVGDDFFKAGDGGGDLGEIPLVVLIVAEVGECAEGLHEALGGTVLENGLDGLFFADFFPEVEELAAVLGGVIHVGVVEEGGEVIFLAAHTEALEVDDVDLVAVKHEVFRLEVAVHHVGGGGAETFGEAEEDGVFAEFGGVLAEVGFDEVLEEVFLLPAVEGFVEKGLEIEVLWRASVEELVELFEGGAVVGLAFFEGGVF